MKPGVHMVVNKLKKLEAGLSLLTKQDVLVGVPASKAQRDDGPMNNATIGYIHEHGAPEANIPARPHLVPGVRESVARFKNYFKQAGQYALQGNTGGVTRALNAAGQTTANHVKDKIAAGLTPPLKLSTIKQRQKRSKNSSYRRKASGASDVVPLHDTGKYLRSISHVVREK